MSDKIKKTVLAGIVGTAVMSAVMMIAPMMGMPKMSPPAMLAGTMGVPIMLGWIMHFMVGIVFAFAYAYLIAPKLKIKNVFVKGAVFGIIIFVLAQIMMAIMGAMMPMPAMSGSMPMLMIGSLMGHIVFGVAVSKTVGSAYEEGIN